VRRSTESGFSLEGANENVFEGNRSQGNLGDGFSVRESSGNQFAGNAAVANGGYGFFDDQPLENT
jgi:parallel beta-helix repeat protein